MDDSGSGAAVEVRESVGSDVHVHFTETGSPARAGELAEIATGSGRTGTGAQEQRVVVRLGTATRATESGIRL